MGKYLKIEKIKSDDFLHFYHVVPSDSDDFYMCINALKKNISFYKNSDFEDQLGSRNFLSEEVFPKIPGIDYRTLVLVIVQASKALQKNEFPMFLSKQS